MQNYIETSMFHVNPNSFTGRLIISTFRETSPWQEPIKFEGLLPPAITSPNSVRTVYEFFNVSQNCHVSKWSETGLTVYRL